MTSIPEASEKTWTWPQVLGAVLFGIAVIAAYWLFYQSDFKYTQARHRMVSEYVGGGALADRTPVRDTAVLDAVRAVPRHRFVRPHDLEDAYEDRPLMTDDAVTITQAYVVAYMAEQLRLEADDRVLEINAGSGYEAAMLAEIVHEVYATAPFLVNAEKAQKSLGALGYENVHVQQADGFAGWPEYGPYDAIFVRAAVTEISEAWGAQLKEGGRMVVPLGDDFLQSLVLLEKRNDGTFLKTQLIPVQFMPLPTLE